MRGSETPPGETLAWSGLVVGVKEGVMGRRWRYLPGLLLLSGLLALGHSAWAGEADLAARQLLLQTVSGAVGDAVLVGADVRIVGTVRNDGLGAAAEFWVEFSWRRVDKAEACCVERVAVPGGLGAGAEVSLDLLLATADLTPGTYEVVFRVDPDLAITETSETNNRASALLFLSAPEPELHPVSVEIAPSSPVERGETVLIATEIENTGEATAGEFQVRFLRYQADLATALGVPDTGWVAFGSTLVPGLARDARLRIEQTLETSILPLVSLEAGAITPYAIRIVVDTPDGVTEEDGLNNEILASLGVKPSDLSRPELRPVSLTFDKTLPLDWGAETSEDVRATVLVINAGGSTAYATPDAPIRVAFAYRKLGERVWTAVSADFVREIRGDLGIEEGRNSDEADAELSFPEPGSYEVRAWVDPENQIDEQNEGNNQLVVGLSVKGTELHPLSVELGSAPVRQGDTLTITSLIENTGQKTADGFVVGFYVDDLRADTFSYSGQGLEEDDVVRVEGSLDTTDLPPGPYVLRVVVDPDDRLPELDEANNAISTPIEILSPAARRSELHPTSLLADPPSPVPAGQAVRVTATLWNTGTIGAERFQVTLSASADGGATWVPFAVEEVPSLARGEKRSVEGWLSTASAAVGARYLVRAVVDSAAQVEEEDETNNTLVASLSLGGATTPSPVGANVTLAALTLTPPSPLPQRMEVRICAQVTNTGQDPVGSFAVDLLYRSDPSGRFVPFATESFSGLGTGRTVIVCRTLDLKSLPLGTIEVKAVADSADAIAEPNESDNERTETIFIGSTSQKPDLSATAIRFDPPSPVEQGRSLLVCVRISNLGAGASGPFGVSFARFAASAVTFATATVSALGPGATVEVCRALETASLAPGTYSVRVSVDSDQRVAEQNEGNNELSASVTLTVPPQPALETLFRASGIVRLFLGDPGTGVLYAASDAGILYALDPTSVSLPGFPFNAGSAIRALALDVGSARAAYVGTAKGDLIAVGLDSGQELRRLSLGEEILALDLDQFGNLYVGTTARLVSLTRAGASRWSTPTSGAVRSVLVDRTKAAVYAITSGGTLLAVSTSGAAKWQADFATPLTALALGEAVYVGSEDGRVRSVSLGGSVGGGFTTGGAISGLAIDAGRTADLTVYATSVDGALYALDRNLGLRWTAASGGPIRAGARVDPRSGLVAFGSDDGRLYVVNPDGRAAFSVSAGNPIRSAPWVDALVERTGSGVILKRTIRFGTEDKDVHQLVARL